MAAIKWQIRLMWKWSFNQIKNPYRYVLLYADEKINMIIILFLYLGHNNHRVYTIWMFQNGSQQV